VLEVESECVRWWWWWCRWWCECEYVYVCVVLCALVKRRGGVMLGSECGVTVYKMCVCVAEWTMLTEKIISEEKKEKIRNFPKLKNLS